MAISTSLNRLDYIDVMRVAAAFAVVAVHVSARVVNNSHLAMFNGGLLISLMLRLGGLSLFSS